MKDKGYIPQRPYIMMMVGGAYNLLKTGLFNMGDLKKLRVQPLDAEQHVRPPRKYDIPEFKPSMKYCKSDDRYLRPTLYCNPREPEVIALANKLGAYKKSDYEFAEAAFHFVKENMKLEILPMDDVSQTIRRGTGTCFQLISAFIALCRAAGIKARYKMFIATNMIQAWVDMVTGADPLIKKWYNTMGYFMLEGEAEVNIDGKWMIAHVAPKAERQAAAGIPITRFGEDSSVGNWFSKVPGSTMIMESMPYGIGGTTKILRKIAPGSMERVNISILNQIEKGRKIIKKAGGFEAYDRQARAEKGPKMPKLEIKEKKEIVFED
jgi:hypothetical protein